MVSPSFSSFSPSSSSEEEEEDELESELLSSLLELLPEESSISWGGTLRQVKGGEVKGGERRGEEGRDNVSVKSKDEGSEGSLLPRPHPAFHRLQYGKAREGLVSSLNEIF